MDQSNLLSPIIRPLGDNEQPAQDHVLVQLDKKTGEPVKGGFLSALFGAPKRISILLDRYVELTDHMIDVRNFITGEIAPVRYRIRLSVPSAPESMRERAAKSLFGRDDAGSPYGIVQRFIGERLKQKIESYTSFDRLPTHAVILRRQEDLAREITREVETDLGLKADIVFEVHHAEAREAIEIRINERVRCRDFPRDDRPLDIYLIVQRGGGAATVAEPRDDAGWKLEIARIVQTAFRERVLLFEYLYQGGRVCETVQAALDADLQRFGRRVASLQVTPGERPLFPPAEHVRVPVEWPGTSNHPVRFQVDARVSVRPDGLQFFMATPHAGKGPQAYGSWMQATVANLLPQALFGMDFTDVAVENEALLASRLDAPLRSAAHSAGLVIEHFVAKPIVEAARYLAPTETIIKPQKYDTNTPGLQVEFEISVMWSIRDLNRVKRLLTPQDVLEQNVRKSIQDAAARVVRQFPPELYASQFDRGIDNSGLPFDPLKEAGSQGRYAADILRAEIARELETQYGITVHARDINFRHNDSLMVDLRRKIDALPQLTIELGFGLLRQNGEPVRANVTTTWRISGPATSNPWAATRKEFDQAFQDSIKQQLSAWTEQLFSSFAEARVTYDQIKSVERLSDEQEKWAAWVNKFMEKHFGLTVQIVSFRCVDIDGEYLLNADPVDRKFAIEKARERRREQALLQTSSAVNDLERRTIEARQNAARGAGFQVPSGGTDGSAPPQIDKPPAAPVKNSDI